MQLMKHGAALAVWVPPASRIQTLRSLGWVVDPVL